MSTIIHLSRFLSNPNSNTQFQNQSTAYRIIENLIRVENLNKSAFSDIDKYIAGLVQGLTYGNLIKKSQPENSLKEKFKQAVLENADE